MAYSDSFPAIRPSFQFNADAGRLDPRITFSRSDTPPTYAAPSAVHYWSNEKHISSHNLAAHNNDLTNFSNDRLDITSGQTSPSGVSDAFKLAQELGSTSAGYCGMQSLSVTSGQRYVYSVYAKAGTNRDFIRIAESLSGSTGKNSYFNLSTGATGTVHADHNATITAVGSSGWYRVSISFTPDASRTGYILNYVTETDNSGTVTDNQGFIYMYGLQLEERDSGGPTVYNATSGQIHREYAPTLKSVSTAGQPRFEYSPTDSASMGLLIEGSSTNLNAQSDYLGWNGTVSTSVSIEQNVAVAPSGELTAGKLTPNDGATGSAYATVTISATSGQAYTHSFYAKADGQRYVAIYGRTTGGVFGGELVHFDLQTGTVASTSGSGVTASMQSAGNGWYRCIATITASATGTGYFRVYVTDGGSLSVTGNGYGGVLIAHSQIEASSHVSSFIATSGSQATRAADSASVATSSFYTGGPVTLTADYDMVDPTANVAAQNIMLLSDGSSSNRVLLYNRSGKSGGYVASADGSTTASGNPSSTAAGAHKLCVVADTNNYIMSFDGTSSTDTAAVLPSGLNQIDIGSGSFSGHVSRVSLFGTAISETAANALTS